MCNFHCVCGNTIYKARSVSSADVPWAFICDSRCLCAIEPHDMNSAISDTCFLANILSA
jgi:hypothetical protein